MLYPTMPVILIALGIFSVLMATNWLVWGLRSIEGVRLPFGVRPADGKPDQDHAHHDGFKNVA